jgi:hypothetical protein
MKTRNILTASFLTILSSSAFGQEAKDLEKQRSIESNPSSYTERGGALPDRKVRFAMQNVEEQDSFIIHKSFNGIEEEKTINYETLEGLAQYKDQASPEYQLLKEKWIEKNRVEYSKQNPVRTTADDKHAFEQRKIKVKPSLNQN